MNYFNQDFCNINNIKRPIITDIDTILEDKMTLICGDFYGIQKFIFEGLATKNASKVLRAKSAFIQIFTIYITKYICSELNIEEKNILTANAGKFEILAPLERVDIENIQNRLNSYFIKNFFGLSGVSIVTISCNKSDFKDKNKYKELRNRVTKAVEVKKFNKLNLMQTNPILNYDQGVTNQTLCPICNIRKKEDKKEECEICNRFIELGRVLVSNKKEIESKYFIVGFNDFNTKIELTKNIKSYILKEEDKPATFEFLAKKSLGLEALGILKADVDSMGKFLKETDITESFKNFDTFSKTLDHFFSIYIPEIMGNKEEGFKNTYTVFTGGDDLFLVGAWNEILAIARRIQEDFKTFIKGELSISFGISIAKPSHPISYLAEHTEELLEKAKEIDIEKVKEKNAITVFNETVKWETYLDTFTTLEKAFKNLKEKDTKTTFLYRLLDICKMSKKVKYENSIIDTMWKSKLAYSFERNMPKAYEKLLTDLNREIENNPEETKMFLTEFIYKRRNN